MIGTTPTRFAVHLFFNSIVFQLLCFFAVLLRTAPVSSSSNFWLCCVFVSSVLYLLCFLAVLFSRSSVYPCMFLFVGYSRAHSRENLRMYFSHRFTGSMCTLKNTTISTYSRIITGGKTVHISHGCFLRTGSLPLYALMMRCWDKEPAKRPTFAAIVRDMGVVCGPAADTQGLTRCVTHPVFYAILSVSVS